MALEEGYRYHAVEKDFTVAPGATETWEHNLGFIPDEIVINLVSGSERLAESNITKTSVDLTNPSGTTPNVSDLKATFWHSVPR
jgi:hypothetical protein